MNSIRQDSFQSQLINDNISTNFRRQVVGAHYSILKPKMPSNPQLLHFSPNMASELGFDSSYLKSNDFLNTVTGKKINENTQPYAMCYGGHQFGHWAGQLGDGRALNLGSINTKDKFWAIQLKGAGETPYSRSADGLAVLRSSIREHLCSEAMFHLGVPTTRSLSLCLSGDDVLRDVMYDGNPAYEKGAIVCRVAPSFVRFGSFEIFSSRKDIKNLKLLTDYTINNFFKEIDITDENAYVLFYKTVVKKTLDMIIHWQRVGFVHGVMNTDNMSILGLTIDYGPYGWLEGFDNDWTPNTTDKQNRRYRFGNQPSIALWNLYQLANALYPLINDVKSLEEALDNYKSDFVAKRIEMMKLKLGFKGDETGDETIINEIEAMLSLTECDMTIFYRLLSKVKQNSLPQDAFNMIQAAFYTKNQIKDDIKDKWLKWFESYLGRIKRQKIIDLEREKSMNKVNPKFVLRNYMAQLAIDDANKGDFNLIKELYTLLTNPYDEQPKYENWFARRPDWARNRVGCSMLSCSS